MVMRRRLPLRHFGGHLLAPIFVSKISKTNRMCDALAIGQSVRQIVIPQQWKT